LGLGIAKKHHKLAVQRNRLKRIVREAFRTHVLQGLDVVVLSKPHPRTIPNAILFKDLQRLFNKLS
jgi:ribonuclease P protein component